MEEKIYGLLKTEKPQNIVLLSLWDLLRARRNSEYRSYVLNAALVIPISKSLIGGARFLTRKTPVRYMPFDFVIRLLTILEKREYSLYLLGGKKSILQKTEKNLRQTFPKLRIVGRYIGRFEQAEQGTILQAIRKAGPSLLLVGKGVRGREKWIARHGGALNPALRLWCSDLFDVFAERRRRPSEGVFRRGMEWIGFCLRNPFKLFRIFPYLYYKLLLVVYRLFVKPSAPETGSE
ncbi:WecB/TagA/CpsF family glycosyltransferase [Breznakiella homolactica]|uniref:WecB/TagA/CpsF family glycosyltransferase n=2 Tax=Breznakiella homolactica TaxID=2798577 RepID=A0A7T7XRR4_9SPIR|nr:WecB/TagA/CpsF family glycosyltransferase [Breznakiella homolactica]